MELSITIFLIILATILAVSAIASVLLICGYMIFIAKIFKSMRK